MDRKEVREVERHRNEIRKIRAKMAGNQSLVRLRLTYKQYEDSLTESIKKHYRRHPTHWLANNATGLLLFLIIAALCTAFVYIAFALAFSTV